MAKIGLQLYTVRDQLEQDFEGTLRKVAALGYQGVEFHTFFGRTAEEVKALLDELGLEILGTHVAYQRLVDHLDEEIAYHKAVGNKYLVVPYLTEEERQWSEVFDNLAKIGTALKEAGLVLCYHNHEFELTEELDGKPVFDVMYETVSADVLQVEMDTCWVHYGGYDPVEYIARYTGRLPIIHLKDMSRNEEGNAVTVELGKGEVNLSAIADAAVGAGVDWIVVEQDHCANPPIQSIETSIQWIKEYANQGGQVNV
ncbi:sugar phosphate isomerase/epimerase [Paenibacillus sp. P96]|uniref:Sugar phosphate isomerase/epimerase n=1 Tax=Paenibacillus zeirhizosphaerae TaxID=2987519 RepID=A0ABT9FQ86_9BACL|nr:sugar phosphate isomerase/epimerase [Paenibacillus sp. P96]MDP4096785.1 sugar phosphate isomerase/epimerase [Paenibacillus sp. P96]